MISLLVQTGSDVSALNNYDQTPVDFGPPDLVKQLGLQQVLTNLNSKIREKIADGSATGQKFLIFDKISQTQREYIQHAKNKWMDIFHGYVK